ncbi:protein-methionine-sulfoxide reductase heme-binding subunit MsrQ [Pectobacterium sp. CHL-2024]|uniref:protein-methionine-sulfoxide reductase heme-binding subunit MsrQ n=1 Tax=Pectobacterium sp. CHL-2024 TaxID=3377079 RepID=UPI003813E1CA
MRLTLQHITRLKVLLHLAGFLPLLWLILSVDQGWFSADPAKDIQHFTGRMALKLLLATLLVTPLARYGKQPLLIRCRRLLGLWCFFWATLHLVSYALLELGLAVTSPQIMMRKLGSQWQKLHNFVYLVAILAPIHYLWSVKTLSPQPILYALAALILLLFRYKKFRQWWR